MSGPPRRDYYRWEVWMDYLIEAILVFAVIASFASGHFLAGAILAVVGLVFAVVHPSR